MTRLKTYWAYYPKTGWQELPFTPTQVYAAGIAHQVNLELGLTPKQAAVLIDAWNRQGKSTGYHYLEHRPEILPHC